MEKTAEGNPNPFQDLTGKNVFVRTVTYHYTGKVEQCIGSFVELSGAAWIADSGRFNEALAKEEFSEVEMYPVDSRVRINTGSIVDFVQIKTLPTESV